MFSLNIQGNPEEKFIRDSLLPLTFGCKASRGLIDDVAFLQTPSKLLITTDSICEEIHYKKDTPPEKVAHKLLARNLSDIACKGASPLYYTLSIFASRHSAPEFLKSFVNGLLPLAKSLKLPLIGGDIACSKSSFFAAAITLYARPAKAVPSRSGAKPGDKIYMTGQLGRAYLGYKNHKDFLPFYETPNPPLKLMQKIINKYKITASIDISDGFIKDIKTLSLASEKGAQIDFLSIPFAGSNSNSIKTPPLSFPEYSEFLTFGDDYEVIFTSPDDIKEKNISYIGFMKNEKVLNIMNTPSGFDIKNEGYLQIK